MYLIQLLAGLSLITFGVRFLRKGIDRLLGGKVAGNVEKIAGTPMRAMGSGVLIGAVAPSSTGLAVLITHLIANGALRTDLMLALLLGANIGLTLLANVVAFSMGGLVGLFLFLGVLGFQFCQGRIVRGIGQCLLAFGFVLLSMQFLKEAAVAISSDADMLALFHVLEQFPWILLGVAAAMGVILQSSTATIGFGMSLAQGGVLAPQLFMVWIVGTNIGLGITSVIVAWGHLEGRRLGYANLVAKLIVAIPLVVFFPKLNIFSEGAGIQLSSQLALSHTAFNVVAALIALPVLKPLLSFVRRWLVPEPTVKEGGRQTYLDFALLSQPPLALVQATREMQRMIDEVREMLMEWWTARENRSVPAVRAVARRDDTVDNLNRQLTLYLSQIDGPISEADNLWRFALLKVSMELEAMGDITELNLARIAIRQAEEGIALDDDHETALTALYEQTLEQYHHLLALLSHRDAKSAAAIIKKKDEILVWCALERRSVNQLLRPDAGSVEEAICYLDTLEAFRQLHKHVAKAAGSIANLDDAHEAHLAANPSQSPQLGTA